MLRLPLLALAALALGFSASGPRALALSVTDFGAVPDGKTNDTAAFARAVAACTAAGGGTIDVPAGRYLTGSIALGDNMELRLEAGAELLYSPDPADSPLVESRWECTNAYTHAPLVYALGRHNVSVKGSGILNGQGRYWWWRSGKVEPERFHEVSSAKAAWLALYARIEAGEKPARAEFALAADYLRPSLVQFNGCRDVKVEGVTLTESPMWMLHPLYSERVSVRGVTFISTGPNGDGIDVDSCRDVRISDCSFSTGDDCIVIKSGRDADGRRTNRPTEQVAISNCVMYKGHGAVVIGSETSGGIRDIAATNIVATGTDRGIRIKSARGRGNRVENLRFSNFVIRDAGSEAIEITTLYTNEPEETFSARTPVFRNFAFSNITITHAKRVVSIHGIPESLIGNLTFSDITADGESGFTCDLAEDVAVREMRVAPEAGPAFAFTRSREVRLDGVAAGNSSPGPVLVDLASCRDVRLANPGEPRGARGFVRARGMSPADVSLAGGEPSPEWVSWEPAKP